jgi:hypothetical protein
VHGHARAEQGQASALAQRAIVVEHAILAAAATVTRRAVGPRAQSLARLYSSQEYCRYNAPVGQIHPFGRTHIGMDMDRWKNCIASAGLPRRLVILDCSTHSTARHSTDSTVVPDPID